LRNLYIDFDGVILDTIAVFYKMMDEQGIDKKDEETVKNFFLEMNWRKILKETPEINNSMSAIQKIIESNKFYVTILTHVYSLNEAVEKVNYIRKFFKDITIIPVPKAISKTKMVYTKDAILVDDFSGNLNEWENEGGIPIKFVKEEKDSVYKTITSLLELIDLDYENLS